jgi:hypothetical protein
VQQERRAQEIPPSGGIALHALGDAAVDAGSLPLDTPLRALSEFTGDQGHARWAAEASGSAEPTSRDLAFVWRGQTGSSVRRTRSPATSRSGARPASMASTSSTQRVLAPSGEWPTVLEVGDLVFAPGPTCCAKVKEPRNAKAGSGLPARRSPRSQSGPCHCRVGSRRNSWITWQIRTRAPTTQPRHCGRRGRTAAGTGSPASGTRCRWTGASRWRWGRSTTPS